MSGIVNDRSDGHLQLRLVIVKRPLRNTHKERGNSDRCRIRQNTARRNHPYVHAWICKRIAPDPIILRGKLQLHPCGDVSPPCLHILERCHKESIQILEDNRDMLDAIAGYLLQKETITGQEMMCILEGKDPALAENYGATPEPSRPAVTDGIEPPARNIHIVSEPVQAPGLPEDDGQSAIPLGGDAPDTAAPDGTTEHADEAAPDAGSDASAAPAPDSYTVSAPAGDGEAADTSAPAQPGQPEDLERRDGQS